MIHVRFACGHEVAFTDELVDAPTCACGQHRVSEVHVSRAPSFRGLCEGPIATLDDTIEPAQTMCAPAGPLIPTKDKTA